MCLLDPSSKHAWEGKMAKGRITKRAVDAAKPADTDTYLWDTDLSGFGLKVSPAGGKVYLVQYRLGGRKGRTRRVTIGRHGSPWTPESARKEAKRLLGEVGAGHDPAEERTQARRDLTIAELCDLYLARRPVGNGPQRIIGKVSVALRRACLLMPKYLADDPLRAVAA